MCSVTRGVCGEPAVCGACCLSPAAASFRAVSMAHPRCYGAAGASCTRNEQTGGDGEGWVDGHGRQGLEGQLLDRGVDHAASNARLCMALSQLQCSSGSTRACMGRRG